MRPVTIARRCPAIWHTIAARRSSPFHVSPSLTNHFPNNQPRGGNPSLIFDTFYQLHLQRDDDDTYCGTMIMAAITRTPATYDYLGTATNLLSLWDCYEELWELAPTNYLLCDYDNNHFGTATKLWELIWLLHYAHDQLCTILCKELGTMTYAYLY